MLTDTKMTEMTTDQKTIRSLIQGVEDGWNNGDGDTFAAPFAEDADYVVVNGRYIQGRSTIAEGHRHLFEHVYPNSHNQATIHSLRFLRDDVAVAHIEWNMRVPMNPVLAERMAQMPNLRGDGTDELKSHAFCSMVFTKENGRWHIAAFQNTPIQSQ